MLQDLLLPTAPVGEEKRFDFGHGHGDLTGSGFASYQVSSYRAWQTAQPPWGVNTTGFYSGLGVSRFAHLDYDLTSTEYSPSGNWKEPESCFLPSPLGLQIALQTSIRDTVRFFDTESGIFLGEVTPPPDHTIFGPIILWAGLFRAGDVDLDGFEDVFAQAYAANGVRVLALIDGQTRTVPWTHYEPFAYGDFIPTRNLEPVPWDDLNGNGSRDLVATFSTYDPFASQFIGFQVALDGFDGSVFGKINSQTPSHMGTTSVAGMSMAMVSMTSCIALGT